MKIYRNLIINYIFVGGFHFYIISLYKKIYKEIKINNDICKYGFKVQQANIKYELSNNNDFDNGVIKTQREEDIKNQEEEKKFYPEDVSSMILKYLKKMFNYFQLNSLLSIDVFM